MVGIEYTGVDGNVTSFGVSSPDEAIGRLRRIKGYNAGIMDGVAASLAGAWNARHKNAERIRAQADTFSADLAAKSRNSFVSNGMRSIRSNDVSSIESDGSSLVVRTADKVIGSDGRVVSVGSEKTRDVIPLNSGKTVMAITDIEFAGTSNGKHTFRITKQPVTLSGDGTGKSMSTLSFDASEGTVYKTGGAVATGVYVGDGSSGSRTIDADISGGATGE